MKLHRNLSKTAILTGLAMMAGSSVMAQTELDFWSWRQEDVAAYNEMIAEFQESHPDITVNFVAHPATEYNTILATALAAGEGPDIIQTRSYGGLEVLAKPGYLEPLNDKVDLSVFSADALLGTSLRSDGQVYAVPFGTQTVVIYYNKDVLAANDVTPPTTWDEFTAAAQKLKDAGVIPSSIAGERAARLTVIDGQPPLVVGPPAACPFRDRCAQAMPVCATKVPPRYDVGDGHDAACFLVDPLEVAHAG